MYNNKKTGILGIIITIVFLIILVVVTNSENKASYNVENTIRKIILPMQNGITYIKNKIEGNDIFFANIKQLEQENAQLKQEKSSLEQSLRELEIIKTENEILKKYLELTEKYQDYKTIPAYVINKPKLTRCEILQKNFYFLLFVNILIIQQYHSLTAKDKEFD